MYNVYSEEFSIQPVQSEENTFFRYAMVVEYIGKAYAGSQRQPNQRTIQSELEAALSVIAKQDIRIIFSGRTDAGVNARSQVAHFDLPYQIDVYRFTHSLNAILPPDISVMVISEVDKSFHSQKSAQFRWYRYTINNKSQRSAWLNNAIHIHTKLNVEEMNRALSYLVGEHDFSSFKSANSTDPTSDCIMYKAECTEENGIINIDLIANRFLYNMVRIIVGTLVGIGKGKFPAEHMLEILNAKDRTQAGPTARPEGLTFMLVDYGKKYDIFDGMINKEAMYHNENILCKAS